MVGMLSEPRKHKKEVFVSEAKKDTIRDRRENGKVLKNESPLQEKGF